MIRRFIGFVVAFGLVASPALGQQKPLVIINGQTQQLPAGTTLGVRAATTGAASLNIPQGAAPTSPNNGDKWLTSTGEFTRIGGATVEVSKTNLASTAAGGVTGTLALTNGGTGATTALAATTNLQFSNGGTGAVARTVTSKLADIINAKDFGAVCNQTTEDAAAINAALTYAGTLGGGAVVQLPPAACKVSSTLTVPRSVTLRGQGGDTGGLLAGATNLSPMVYLSDEYASVEDLYINMGAAGANSSGFTIQTAVKTGSLIRDLRIDGSCGALDINGNLHEISKVYIYNSQGTSCSVVSVGRLTTLAGTVDVKFDHVTVTSVNTASRPAYCWDILDAGGLFIAHSDAIYCNVGTVVRPAANQQVIWATFHDTYLADSNASNGFVIAPQAASAVVKGLSCSNCWSGSSGAAGVLIQNGSGGTLTTLNFVGLRVFGAAGNAVTLSASDKIRISDSMLCGYGQTGVFADTNVGGFSVTDSTIRPDCAALSSAGQYGVLLGGSNATVTLSNLDAQSNSVASIAGLPTGNSFVTNITAQSNVFGTKATASTVSLDQIIANWTLTGTTGVSTISGAWNGREVNLITTGGAVAFSTGGNICNALTSTQNVPIIATYSGTCWYLK